MNPDPHLKSAPGVERLRLTRRVLRDLALLAIGALLYTFAAPPYEWATAAWLALTPFFLTLRDKTPSAAFTTGFVYGVLFSAGITYWAYFAVAAYFSLSWVGNFLVTFLIYGLFVGPYIGLVASLSCWLMRSGSWLRWVGIPAAWVSGEFARSSLFSGFAWELLGHTQYQNLRLIQVTDVTGVYGLSFLLALSGYLAAECLSALPSFPSVIRHPSAVLRSLPWPAIACFLMSLGLSGAYGTVRLQHYSPVHLASAEPVELALVLGNVPSAQRWQRLYYAKTLLKYAAVTRQGIADEQLDLVVWPEFAVGFYVDREPLLRTQLSWLTESINAPLLVGAPRAEDFPEGPRFYNSAYLLAADGELLGVYDKIRLLPFAEYQPLSLAALASPHGESSSEFTAGSRSTIFSLPKSTFGVTICYEVTYPALARRLVQDGAQLLVNLANESWLAVGGTAATAQHFSLAIFRAVENKRFLARVATAGISGFVDPTGRPYQLSTAERGVVLGQVVPQDGLTVYAQYGDWFACACVLFSFAALLAGQQKILGSRKQL